jgi:hypothetical protein
MAAVKSQGVNQRSHTIIEIHDRSLEIFQNTPECTGLFDSQQNVIKIARKIEETLVKVNLDTLTTLVLTRASP